MVVAASEEVAAVLTVAVEADAEVVAVAADSGWAAVAVVAAVAVDDPPHTNKVTLIKAHFFNSTDYYFFLRFFTFFGIFDFFRFFCLFLTTFTRTRS